RLEAWRFGVAGIGRVPGGRRPIRGRAAPDPGHSGRRHLWRIPTMRNDMTIRWPRPTLILLSLVSILLFFGLAAWGWGSARGLLAHPARAGAFLVMALLAIAVLFSGANLLSGGRREDR